MKILRFSILLFIFLNWSFFCFSQISQEEIEILNAFMKSEDLSEEDIKKIEEKIRENPEDLILRAKILGYYYRRSLEDFELRKKYQENVLWVIKNKPKSKLAAYCELNKIIDKEKYMEAKNLWLENLKKFKKDPIVLENAVDFFILEEKDLAKDILNKLQKEYPENPNYFQKLGHLYKLEMIGKKGKEREESAKKALFQFEKAYSLEKDDMGKIVLLEEMALLSFDSGEIEKAKNYSSMLLKDAEKWKGEWFYGNAIHYGNIVKGKIALKEKRINEAKKYLIEAGKTPGSPQLSSFGPDFTLAQELLEIGENEVVLEYLELCKRFWEMGTEDIKKWESQIKSGKKPDW